MTPQRRPTIHSDEVILVTARQLQQEGRLSRPNLKTALEELADRAGHGRASGDSKRLASVVVAVRGEARAGAATARAAATAEGAGALPPTIRAALEQMAAACRREFDALRAEEEDCAKQLLQAERRDSAGRYALLEAELAALSQEAVDEAAYTDSLRTAHAEAAASLDAAEEQIATLARELADERAARVRHDHALDEERRESRARLEAASGAVLAAETALREAEVGRERMRGAYEAERAMRARCEAERDRRERDLLELQACVTALVGELAEARAVLAAHRRSATEQVS